jgi:hypothetical protein
MGTAAKDISDPEIFEQQSFEVVRTTGAQADSRGSIQLSPWQLVNDANVFKQMAEEQASLVSDVLHTSMREHAFRRRMTKTFTEMKYLTGPTELKKLFKIVNVDLLCVYWTASNQHEAFVRGQKHEIKLSDRSWAIISKWFEKGSSVGNSEVLSAIFSATMIMKLGKIPKFAQQMAPLVDRDDHKAILAHIIDTCPRILPSYYRLEEKHRTLIRALVTRHFNMEHFLQMENLPANLTCIKEMLADMVVQPLEKKLESKVVLECFLFLLFIDLAGSAGDESQEGSAFMTEDSFQRFHIGHEALLRLDRESEL